MGSGGTVKENIYVCVGDGYLEGSCPGRQAHLGHVIPWQTAGRTALEH